MVGRVLLIHWNADEAEERAARLRTAGFRTDFNVPLSGASLRSLRDDPPDAFVIDLSRLPSHGRAVAVALRQQKATRHVPIVFVSGDPDKVSRVRELLPDAVYTEWSRVAGALRRAIRHRAEAPVVPATMGAYSTSPLPKKLGIKAGAVVALRGAPAGFEASLGAVPEGVRFQRQARGPAGLMLLFARSRAELERRFPAAARALAPGGGLWIAWPKQASGLATDLTQAEVRRFGLDAGFVDYKICAIDQTWSGLLFARRRT